MRVRRADGGTCRRADLHAYAGPHSLAGFDAHCGARHSSDGGRRRSNGAHRRSNTHTIADLSSDPDAHIIADRGSYPNAHSPANAQPDAHADTYSDAYAVAYPYTDANPRAKAVDGVRPRDLARRRGHRSRRLRGCERVGNVRVGAAQQARRR